MALNRAPAPNQALDSFPTGIASNGVEPAANSPPFPESLAFGVECIGSSGTTGTAPENHSRTSSPPPRRSYPLPIPGNGPSSRRPVRWVPVGGPILEFSGGFSAVMLGFVLPGVCPPPQSPHPLGGFPVRSSQSCAALPTGHRLGGLTRGRRSRSHSSNGIALSRLPPQSIGPPNFCATFPAYFLLPN